MNPTDPMDDDFRDSEISSLLGRVGGDAPATDAAYHDVLHRVRRVRRRRTIVTTLGAGILIVAVGTLVVQSSSRRSDRVALEPRSAVVTTPDGSVVTTPDGVAVTVIIEPNDTTTPTTPGSDDVPGSGGNPGNSAPGSNSTTPSDPGTSDPSDSSVPSGTNRPTGSTDDTTTPAPTTPATTTTKPTPATTTTKPTPATTTTTTTTKPSLPPTTKPVVPSVPVTARPTTPTPTTAPRFDNVTYACGAGAIDVDVVNNSFVVGSLTTRVLPGFNASIKSVKAKSIEIEFTSARGKTVATLKMRISGSKVEKECGLEVDAKAESNDDSRDDARDDNNGERAGD